MESPAAPAAEEEYDSDYGSHHDVSRTVSDQSTAELEQDIDRLRLEFARKLGYTDGQVQAALSKLGPRPSQNSLLAELIHLDSSSNSGKVSSEEEPPQQQLLRHIVIDGSNVAMSHGQNKSFSCRGIELAVEWFEKRGHTDITVFVPSFRRGDGGEEIKDPHILTKLESCGRLVFTPSRRQLNKKLVTCYDDRYILKLAMETEGVIVSNDNYRDLQSESEDYKRLVEERILMYSFVGDRFMPPDDPLGRNGPNLAQFLSKTILKQGPPCPYGRKCTYGSKCKYFHPVIKQSVSESLRKAASATQSLPLSTLGEKPLLSRVKSAGEAHQNGHRRLRREYSVVDSSPVSMATSASSILSPFPNQPHLSRVWSPIGQVTPATEDPVYYHLAAIFPPHQVRHVMDLYRNERDPQVLCRHIVRLFS